jgi:hypothetical protein
MKAILFNYKNVYSVFSTILVTIFSSLFYISSHFGHGKAPGYIFDCQFFFIYKTMAYLLFFNAIALFIIMTRTALDYEIDNKKKIFTVKEVNLVILISIFLIIGFMLYLLPLFMGMLIIFLYCFFTDSVKQRFRFLSQMLLFFTIIFICFDLLMTFYLSTSLFFAVQWFFPIEFFSLIFEIIPRFIIAYMILFGLSVLSILIQQIYSKYFNEKNKNFLRYRINSKVIFKYCLIIFTVVLIIEIIVIFLGELFLNFELDKKFIFFYYIDKVLLNIGIIGITAGYLSYFCFRNDKELFYFLFLWIFLAFFIGSILIFINWFRSFSFYLNAIDKHSRNLMDFWFNRVWIYSILPLCILSSIGTINFVKRIKMIPKYKKIFKNKNRENILKFTSLSLLIFLSYSNLMMAGIWSGNINNRPSKEEIELLSWMSKNIPNDSNFLIEKDYIIRVGIFTMVNGHYYFFEDIFDSDNNETENIEEIDYLIDKDIEYMLISEDYLYGSSNRSKFIRNYLRSNFYNETEHRTNHYRLYYAPYFD